jgi:hypothetical protein
MGGEWVGVRAAQLGKDLVEEGDAGDDALSLSDICIAFNGREGRGTLLFPRRRASPSDSPTTKPP